MGGLRTTFGLSTLQSSVLLGTDLSFVAVIVDVAAAAMAVLDHWHRLRPSSEGRPDLPDDPTTPPSTRRYMYRRSCRDAGFLRARPPAVALLDVGEQQRSVRRDLVELAHVVVGIVEVLVRVVPEGELPRMGFNLRNGHTKRNTKHTCRLHINENIVTINIDS